MPTYTNRFALFSAILLAMCCTNAALAITYTSAATGSWSNPASWSPAGVPVAGDDVTVTTHTITLTADAACNNITLQGTSGNRLALTTFTLVVSGSLSGSTSTPSTTLITNTTGKVQFIGASRALFAASPNWGANVPNWQCEIALDAGATGTASTNLKFGDLIITSGTFSLGAGNELRIDKGADGLGTLSISAGGILLSQSIVGTRTGTATTYCSSVTIDGVLETSGTRINGTTITVNGTLRLKSALALVSSPSSALDPEFVYGLNGVLEYNRTGESLMGAEVNRAATTVNPTVSIMRVNSTTGVQTNFQTPRVNNLDFLSGKVRCNGSNIVIVSGGSITGESAANYVVTASTTAGLRREGMGSGEFPVGTTANYLPVETFSNSGTTDIFTVHVTEAFAGCIPLISQASSTTVTWDIAEAVAGGSDCTIAFNHGFAIPGMNFVPGSAFIVHCNGSVIDYTNGTAIGNVVTGSGFTSFSPFGITSDLALPLELKSFSGKPFDRYNELYWTTSSERNVAWHIIERSPNGFDLWKETGKAPGKGDAFFDQKYSLIDDLPLAKGFYRLRTIDTDGHQNLSNSIVINRTDNYTGIINVFPNPASNLVTVNYNASEESDIEIVVTDMSGRKIIYQNTVLAKGSNMIPVQLDRLIAGSYILTVVGSNIISEPVRLVKE